MSLALVPTVANVPALPAYVNALAAVEACASVDEAAELHDQAAAVAAYASRARDKRLLCLAQEIRLRAGLRLGVLISAIDRASPMGHGRFVLPNNGQPKAAILRAAQLTPSVAYRWQALSGGTDTDRQSIAARTADAFFARCRQRGRPASMVKLRSTILGTGEATRRRRRTTPPPAPTPPAPARMPLPLPPRSIPPMDESTRLILAIRIMARMDARRLPDLLARATTANASLRLEAEAAERSLSQWIALLCVAAPRRAAACVA